MTYQVVDPQASAVISNGSELQPLITLKDEYGGVAHIATDDNCFVLYLERDGVAFPVTHWSPEAAASLADYEREHKVLPQTVLRRVIEDRVRGSNCRFVVQQRVDNGPWNDVAVTETEAEALERHEALQSGPRVITQSGEFVMTMTVETAARSESPQAHQASARSESPEVPDDQQCSQERGQSVD